MTDLFIDTDVIIDFIIDRQPFSREAAQVFTLIDQKKVKGYASVLSYSNIVYVLRNHASHKKVITILNELSDLVGILKVDDDIIRLLSLLTLKISRTLSNIILPRNIKGLM